MWNPSNCLLKQTRPFPPKQTGLLRDSAVLTDWPCEWDRAGGGSTQNANHLVTTDWITPLLPAKVPERPTVGICQGRRSCRSFIRATMTVSLLHHIIWLPACAASTMTHNHLCGQWLLFNHRQAFSLLGVWFQCLKSWGQGWDNLEKMLWVTQKT